MSASKATEFARELAERLAPGDAADEVALPAEARFRDEGRGVRFDECGRDGRMRAAAVLRHAQDIAWRHSERLEYGRAWYEARGVGWVVRGIDLLVDRPPLSNESITGTTSLAGFRHVMARRHTRLFASSGRVIADAAIDWVMTDAAGRPTRFPAEFEPFVARVGATFLPMKLPSAPTDGGGVRTVEVPLRTSDIDPLGHVNHAAWLEIVEEAVAVVAPEQLAAPRRRIRLEYLAVTEGSRAFVQCRQEQDSADLRIDIRDDRGVPLLRGLLTSLLADPSDPRDCTTRG
jgi:acyl-ACP thioesterase